MVRQGQLEQLVRETYMLGMQSIGQLAKGSRVWRRCDVVVLPRPVYGGRKGTMETGPTNRAKSCMVYCAVLHLYAVASDIGNQPHVDAFLCS